MSAVPFCLEHREDWVDGCTSCSGAQDVQLMTEQHRAQTGCWGPWPLCDPETEHPLLP